MTRRSKWLGVVHDAEPLNYTRAQAVCSCDWLSIRANGALINRATRRRAKAQRARH
jgi:hypothetical protein